MPSGRQTTPASGDLWHSLASRQYHEEPFSPLRASRCATLCVSGSGITRLMVGPGLNRRGPPPPLPGAYYQDLDIRWPDMSSQVTTCDEP